MAAAIVAARTGRKIAAQKRKARERWHESVAAHLREDVLDAFTSVDDDDDGSVTREELRALFSAVLPKIKKRLRAQDAAVETDESLDAPDTDATFEEVLLVYKSMLHGAVEQGLFRDPLKPVPQELYTLEQATVMIEEWVKKRGKEDAINTEEAVGLEVDRRPALHTRLGGRNHHGRRDANPNVIAQFRVCVLSRAS